MKLQQIRWRTAAGTITLLPSRGRVLQVNVGGVEAYWVNPRWTGDWNVGGDRLWLSPEADFNWPTRHVDFSKYIVPAAVDPGRWELERHERGFCQVRQQVTVPHMHKAVKVRGELRRSFTMVELPDAPGLMAYRTDNELQLVDGPVGQGVGLWSLLQVPKGGEMIIGCRRKGMFRTHFGTVPARLRQIRKGEVRLRITGDHQYKIGVPNDIPTGRMVYARPVGEKYLVIARQFFPQPWRAYCDAPLSARGTPGDAVQVYNDSGALGGFGEMEFHSPALVVGRGADRLLDSYLTMVGFVAAREWPRWLRRWLAGQ